MDRSWAIAGRGNIGSELMQQIYAGEAPGLKPYPQFMITSEGVRTCDGTKRYGVADIRDIPPFLMPDVLFLANPTTADGQPAYTYAEHALKSGKVVITAEKGAISKYYRKLALLSDGFRRLGISATAGGGSLILPKSEYIIGGDVRNVSSILGVINGTLQATYNQASSIYGEGLSPEDSVIWSQSQGFAEPGNLSPFDILRAEIDGDIPKKLVVYLRKVLGLNNLNANDLRGEPLNDETLRRSFAEDRRYVMALANMAFGETIPDLDLIGKVSHEHQGWRIQRGFQKLGSATLNELLTMNGPGNGVVISLGRSGKDGIYTVTGPGAGAEPTASAMIFDYKEKVVLAESDPTLGDRVKKYRGGKPRRIYSEAEKIDYTRDLHWKNIATLQAAGMKMAKSLVWWPNTGSNFLDQFDSIRHELELRFGSEVVFNGPGLLPNDNPNGPFEIGFWVPDDMERFLECDELLTLENGHWLIDGKHAEPMIESSKIKTFSDLSIFRNNART